MVRVGEVLAADTTGGKVAVDTITGSWSERLVMDTGKTENRRKSLEYEKMKVLW